MRTSTAGTRRAARLGWRESARRTEPARGSASGPGQVFARRSAPAVVVDRALGAWRRGPPPSRETASSSVARAGRRDRRPAPGIDPRSALAGPAYEAARSRRPQDRLRPTHGSSSLHPGPHPGRHDTRPGAARGRADHGDGTHGRRGGVGRCPPARTPATHRHTPRLPGRCHDARHDESSRGATRSGGRVVADPNRGCRRGAESCRHELVGPLARVSGLVARCWPRLQRGHQPASGDPVRDHVAGGTPAGSGAEPIECRSDHRWLLFLAPVLSVWSAYLAGRVVTLSRGARAVVGLAWGVSSVMTMAVSEGRVTAALGHVLVPFVLAGFALAAQRHGTYTATFATALATALLGALVPPFLIVSTAAALGLLLVGPGDPPAAGARAPDRPASPAGAVGRQRRRGLAAAPLGPRPALDRGAARAVADPPRRGRRRPRPPLAAPLLPALSPPLPPSRRWATR